MGIRILFLLALLFRSYSSFAFLDLAPYAGLLEEEVSKALGESGNLDPEKTLGDQGIYIFPNETKPEEALPFLRAAPHTEKSIHIAVGTERAFMGALVSAEHLLAVDCDPSVLIYNLSLVELFKIAKSARDFYRLRMDRGFLIHRLHALEPTEGRGFLLRVAKSSLWEKIVNESKDSWFWKPLNPSEEPRDVIYWQNPKAFCQLKAMAQDDRIRITRTSLEKEEDINLIVEAITSKNKSLKSDEEGYSISCLDISNAWWNCYMGDVNKTVQLVDILDPVSHPESVLLLSWYPGGDDFKPSFAYQLRQREDSYVFQHQFDKDPEKDEKLKLTWTQFQAEVWKMAFRGETLSLGLQHYYDLFSFGNQLLFVGFEMKDFAAWAFPSSGGNINNKEMVFPNRRDTSPLDDFEAYALVEASYLKDRYEAQLLEFILDYLKEKLSAAEEVHLMTRRDELAQLFAAPLSESYPKEGCD